MSGCVIDFCISDRCTSTCGKFCTILRKCSNPTLHDHYRGIFSEDAADRSFQRHQDVSVYIFKDAGDPNDRSICNPAVSFRSCSLGDHGINVWNAKWKHGSDDGNRLWIRQFHLQQRNRTDNTVIDHNVADCSISYLTLRFINNVLTYTDIIYPYIVDKILKSRPSCG